MNISERPVTIYRDHRGRVSKVEVTDGTNTIEIPITGFSYEFDHNGMGGALSLRFHGLRVRFVDE
jgi:hypothetical protein